MKYNVVTNKFVHRQTPESQFTHWDITQLELEQRIQNSFEHKLPGYRKGVWRVAVEPEGFWSPVVTLEPGDELQGDFSSRVEGEEPRQHHYKIGPKSAAQFVEVILYESYVLAEGGNNQYDDAFEIIAVNASPIPEESPIQPNTLIANHFTNGSDGGTSTGLSDREFVALLEKSVKWWKNRTLSMPEKTE